MSSKIIFTNSVAKGEGGSLHCLLPRQLLCHSSSLRSPQRMLQRTSIHNQLVTLLQQGIDSGRWRGELPSEAELCREFQVARMTLRKALAQLAHERWIVPRGHGYRPQIRRRPTRLVPVAGRTIRVLSPISALGLGGVQHAAIEILAERLSTEGYRLEFEHRPKLFQRHSAAELSRLDALPGTAGWILFYSTEPIQRWFSSSAHPCVVAGPLHEDIALSCVYPDTRALGRHVAGRLYARGYRELIYLLQAGDSLGCVRASQSFFDEARRLGARARVIEHDHGAPAIREVMRELLARRVRPDGFVVPNSVHAITTLCCLLSAHVRVPEDAAVIAGWDDPSLEFTTPEMTRYRIDGAKFGRKLALALLDLLEHGSGKTRSVQMLPEFVPGGTLGMKR